jgi:hypothetical protein
VATSQSTQYLIVRLQSVLQDSASKRFFAQIVRNLCYTASFQEEVQCCNWDHKRCLADSSRIASALETPRLLKAFEAINCLSFTIPLLFINLCP